MEKLNDKTSSACVADGAPLIGRLIEQTLRSQKRSVKWLSDRLHCDRRNVYDIFHRNAIDTNLLMDLSVILRTNFFICYVEAIDQILESSEN